LKFLGALRHASGKETLTLNCQKNASIMDIVNEISRGAPVFRQSLINEQLQKPKPNALILINGREISILDNLETKIEDGDEVVFVPVVHGG
jgi:sulfur-carrier protein